MLEKTNYGLEKEQWDNIFSEGWDECYELEVRPLLADIEQLKFELSVYKNIKEK